MSSASMKSLARSSVSGSAMYVASSRLVRLRTAVPRPDASSAERFAARFAAKEAALKALRPDTTAIDWRSIEVRRHASGWCDVVLHGEAAALAARQGIDIAGAQHEPRRRLRHCSRRGGPGGRAYE